MPKTETATCPDCGTEFGSKWARADHAKHCPVQQSAELRRMQEQLEWKRTRIVRWVEESYQSAVRAFTAYHNGQTELAHRFHGWLAEDFPDRVRDLEALSDAVAQAQRVHFPRMSRLTSDVALLLDQANELASILSTLHRDYGVRP